ncbi:unnamed protein product [Discula destructiva]
MACLRGADLSELQQGNVVQAFPGADGVPNWYWLPVTEGPGSLVPGLLCHSFASGRFVKVPLMVGNDNDEGIVFVPNASTPADVSKFLKNNYPGREPLYYQRCIPSKCISASGKSHGLLSQPGGRVRGCPGNFLAEAVASFLVGHKVWNYRVNVLDPMGVPHVFENSAIFGPGNAGPYSAGWNSTNKAIIPEVMNYYIRFVRILNPSILKFAQAPAWETWGSLGRGIGRRLKWQTNDTVMEKVPGTPADRCALWTSLSNTPPQ